VDYPINKLAKLAGVSTRTLRYYDQIGLLKPAYTTDAGYRMYSTREVDALQHILFYRALDFELGAIKKLLAAPEFDRQVALLEHLEALKARKKQIGRLISTVEKTITTIEKGSTMTDAEKFEGFKQEMLDENERKYGDEVRETWGADAYAQSAAKVKNMTQEQWDETERLREEINTNLNAAVADGDPSGELAQRACDAHRQWLCYFWPDGMYSKEGHLAMAEMYCSDPRFKKHYEDVVEGGAEFLRDAMKVYTA
jgi:DNA-binding transcriptional MerR regulator